VIVPKFWEPRIVCPTSHTANLLRARGFCGQKPWVELRVELQEEFADLSVA
jgi:hypothetical protein